MISFFPLPLPPYFTSLDGANRQTNEQIDRAYLVMYITFFLPFSYMCFYIYLKVMLHTFLFTLVFFGIGIGPFSFYFILFGKHVFLVTFFGSTSYVFVCKLFDVLLSLFYWLAGWLAGCFGGAVPDWSSFLFIFIKF